MLGLSTGLELRLAFYGALLAAICVALLYEHHQGYEACHAPEVAAQKAQKASDMKADQGAVSANDQNKASLTAPGGAASTPPPHLTGCLRVPSVLSARSATSQAKPGEPSSVFSDRGVSSGAQAGPTVDYGPVLQDFALAGLLRASQGDELWKRDVEQAKPVR